MAAALGLAVALVVPAAVSADTGGGGGTAGGATMTFGSVTIVGKLVANVTVNLRCDPLDTIDPITFEPTTTTAGVLDGLTVQLRQAQGRTIDLGYAEAFGPTVVCDSSTINTFVVGVLAQNSPWHGGGAIAFADVFVHDAAYVGLDAGSTGAVSVKIAGK